jgi:hypothetical protein
VPAGRDHRASGVTGLLLLAGLIWADCGYAPTVVVAPRGKVNRSRELTRKNTSFFAPYDVCFVVSVRPGRSGQRAVSG